MNAITETPLQEATKVAREMRGRKENREKIIGFLENGWGRDIAAQAIAAAFCGAPDLDETPSKAAGPAPIIADPVQGANTTSELVEETHAPVSDHSITLDLQTVTEEGAKPVLSKPESANEPEQSEPTAEIKDAALHFVKETDSFTETVERLISKFNITPDDAKSFAGEAMEAARWEEVQSNLTLTREAAEARDRELATKAERDHLFIENYGFKHRKRMKVSPEDEAKAAEYLRTQKPNVPETKITRMDFVKKKKLYWLWEHRIPFGFLSTIAGEPDEGKSLITLYLAACVSKGEKLYGNLLDTEPGEVLLLSAEDDPETTLRPRLEAAGAALDRIHLLESVMLTNGPGQEGSERLAQLDTDIKAIEAILDAHPEITLIIIDPISSFLGAANMNREQEVRRVLEPLRRRARKSGIAVVMVAHFNKNSDTRSAMDRVGGAKAIVGMGRAAWTCVREPKKEEQKPGTIVDVDRRLFLKLKANLTPSRVGGLVYTIRTKMVEVEDKHLKLTEEEQPRIVWLEETSSTAQEIMIGGEEPKVNKAKSAKEWLKTYLGSVGGYAESAAVREAGEKAGYSKTTLYRAKAELKVNEVWGGEHTSYWVLPGVVVPTVGLHGIKVNSEAVSTNG